MPATGHVQRALPVITEFVKRQYTVLVYGHQKHKQMIKNAGGIFLDLFGIYPIEAVDSESIPVPIRFVSYAAYFYEDIKRMVKEIGPALMIHDSFSVVAQLVAIDLGVPYINICAGHNRPSDVVRNDFANRPGHSISHSCIAAVEKFNRENKHVKLDPYYIADMYSPYLNLYCEPPQFLNTKSRKAFEPVALFGSINPDRDNYVDQVSAYFTPQSKCKIYASFGTAVWRYYRRQALESILELIRYFKKNQDVEIIFSMGGEKLKSHERDRLQNAENVTVEDYVDQWVILREADLFITHHGLNSTHEAIFNGVLMLSHPFFYDQPSLARRCQELGLAIPLIRDVSERLSQDIIDMAYETYRLNRDGMKRKISEARGWEVETMRNRADTLSAIESKIAKPVGTI